VERLREKQWNAMKIRLQLVRKGSVVAEELDVESDSVPRVGESVMTDQLLKSRFRTLKTHLRVVDIKHEHKDGRLYPVVLCEERADATR